ncbi:MAG TPA: DUF937 domain-containing protein [Oculatellaceae cyanobacterium]|jgi:hypothetical protein
MTFFSQILGALQNSDQAGSSGQVANILSTVDQVSDSYGTDRNTTQSALSIVGNYVRSALQQKRETEGYEQAQSLVNQYSGSYPNPQAVNSIFSGGQLNGVIDAVAQRTGLNPQMVAQMLPILVPIVLNMLQTGSNAQSPQGGNPVLNAFLDADHDGDVDISDAMHLAAKHISR